MNVIFTSRADGQVDARVDGYSVFNEALADSISSLPPRGHPGFGPSPYWIDVASAGARAAAASGDVRPFTAGNITLLRCEGGHVIAAFDFDEHEDEVERMALEEFLVLLARWRSLVIEAQRNASEPLPETYRRNPHSPRVRRRWSWLIRRRW